jgi:hypothetical protein
VASRGKTIFALSVSAEWQSTRMPCYRLDLPPIAKAVQLIKAGSSLWMNETTGKNFEWQEGYAAFTVSLSNLDSVKRYIRNQEQHHRKIDFAEEWKLLLKKHGIVLPYR